MRLRKMAVAVGVVAFAVAGCGEEKSSGVPAGNAPPPTSNEKPKSVEDTPSGTELAVGETARIPYPIEGGSKENTKLELTVFSVDKGAIADLKDFDLDEEEKTSEPFYVKLHIRNVGEKAAKTLPVSSGGYLGASSETSAMRNILRPRDVDFAKCDGDPPDSIAPGAEYDDCRIWIAPSGSSLREIEAVASTDSGLFHVAWKVG